MNRPKTHHSRSAWPLVAVVLTLLLALTALPASARTITTLAGTGVAGYSGDGGPAARAQLDSPRGITVAADGAILFVDFGSSRIRRVAGDGTITTAAGSHTSGFGGDGGPATSALLHLPRDVTAAPGGGFYIADSLNNRVRRVLPNGTITTVAGNGSNGGGGDGEPAINASLMDPEAVAVTTDGSLLIADWMSSLVRRVSPTGIIGTSAGVGSIGFNGDNRPAAGAALNAPEGLAATSDGGFLIADTYNARIRKVSPTGVITTVAGTGTSGFSGDGGPATAALIQSPSGIVALDDGSFVFADTGNQRIRQVSSEGIITTIAGTGVQGFTGDGGPALQADINEPKDVARMNDGAIVFTEYDGHRIRRISPPPAPSPAPAPVPSPAPTPPPSAPAPNGPPAPTAKISSPTLRIARVDTGRQFGLSATLPVAARRTAKFQIHTRGRWITRATARTGPRGQVRARLRVRIADFGNKRSIPARITAAGRTFRAAPFRRAQIPAIRHRLTVRATVSNAPGDTVVIQVRHGKRWASIGRARVPTDGRIIYRRTIAPRYGSQSKLAVRLRLRPTTTTKAVTGPARSIALTKR